MPDIASADVILMPVHNRCATTQRALQRLADDGVLGWATVLVIDDGSADATAAIIAREFPAVALLQGDGSWWWCGAIRRGMEWALARGAERIYWLNDDCSPGPGMLAALRDFTIQQGGVAWLEIQTAGGWTYGAHRRTWMGIRPCTKAEVARGRIDTFSGNCVCLNRTAIAQAGLPHDQLFPQGFGDLDYGLRLAAAGVRLQPVPNLVAGNADPARHNSESWLASDRPMREIWRDFSSPRSFLYFPAWRHFALRHWGFFWGWAVFSAPYARWVAIAGLRAVAPALARRWGTHQRAR